VAIEYAPVEIRRPGLLTTIAVLDFLCGGLMLLGAGSALLGALAAGSRSGDKEALAGLLGMVFVYGGLGLLQVAAGIGVWRLRSWGRVLQIIANCLCMPCGLLVGIPSLIYMLRPGVRILCSGRSAEELSDSEAADVAKVLQGGGASTVLVVIVAVLGVVAVIGIIAAIAIPSLLAARLAANEAAAKANLRAFVSAEAAYAGSNGNYYDTPACLAAPANCLPSPPAAAFLDPSISFGSASRGYVLEFHPGESAPPDELDGGRVSRSSLSGYAVTAVPVKANQTGRQSFCADASGIVCSVADGVPRVVNGTCDPSACNPVR